MKIGILGGTGPAGSALAARLASVGHDVTIGSRTEERAREALAAIVDEWPELAARLTAGANDAATAADLVVVATPWDSAATTAGDHREALEGKIVISMANALVRIGREFQPLVPPRGSVAAHVQAAIPASHVVAAFHHVPAKELGHIGAPIESDVMICGDDAPSVRAVAEIVDQIPGCRALLAGTLTSAGAIESLTAVLLQLNVRYKTRVAPRLNGIDTLPGGVGSNGEREGQQAIAR